MGRYLGELRGNRCLIEGISRVECVTDPSKPLKHKSNIHYAQPGDTVSFGNSLYVWEGSWNLKYRDTLLGCCTDTREPSAKERDASAFHMIKRVIFNDPATIVFWKDGTKTVVKTNGGDKFDKEKGLAMAIAKKFFGNTYDYYGVFKKWVKE